MIGRPMWYFRLAVIFVISSLGIQPSTSAEIRPNIVIILADDFGVGDIQAHYPRNKIATPYLDRLVQQGMSFTDAHSPSAVCSPTRYGLLTGRYAWRTRLQEWVIAAYEPPLIAGAEIPSIGGEDSLSFMPSLRGDQSPKQADGQRRTTLVSHSNHGEFAYRDGTWKLVFRMSGRNLEQSRGKPTVAELYQLETDIDEQIDLSEQEPEIVKRMTEGLRAVIARGASRLGQKSRNDTEIRFDSIQLKRWGERLSNEKK